MLVPRAACQRATAGPPLRHCHSRIPLGAHCEGSGECDTSDLADNCRLPTGTLLRHEQTLDVYVSSSCEPTRSHARHSTPVTAAALSTVLIGVVAGCTLRALLTRRRRRRRGMRLATEESAGREVG